MAHFVDGYVIPIKKKNIAEYKKMAKLGCKLWMEYGALSYYETAGVELKNTWGLPFTKMCKLKNDETVIFAFVVFKSKKHRDLVNKKVHSDKRMQFDASFKMPFDMKRFSVGGFESIVNS